MVYVTSCLHKADFIGGTFTQPRVDQPQTSAQWQPLTLSVYAVIFVVDALMNLALLSDTEVWARLQAAEVSALATLYDRYGKLVYRLAYKMLENTQEAEDLTQEIFLNLWQKQTYDPQRAALSTFLMTMTRSRALDRLRQRTSKQRLAQTWAAIVPNLPPHPLEQASLDERASQVQEALKALPEAQREVLELAYYKGLSHSQIALQLVTPLGTIKTRVRQGLLKLNTLLQPFLE